jgi:predicted porin
MKKSLIALAALAATASFAQSSVSIDGAMRIGVLNNKAGTTITPNQGSANVFNFRISEDLGGGLKAMAMTQRRFDATNGAERNESGAAGNAAGFHLAVVSLAGGFGQIDLGRIGLDQNWGYNPFGSNGAHLNPISFAGATQNGQWRYTLPTLVAGLKLSVAGAVQGNNAGAEADSQQLLATYATGPLSVTVVSEKVYGNQVGGVGANSGGATPAASASAKAGGSKLFTVGASYDLGVAKIMAIAGNEENATTGAKLNKGTSISATVPFGATTLKVGLLNDQHTTNNDKVSVGVDYALSKRTTVSADTYKIRNAATNLGQQTWIGVRHAF